MSYLPARINSPPAQLRGKRKGEDSSPWVPNLWYMYHWWYISHCQVVHLEAQRKKKRCNNTTETKCIKISKTSFAPSNAATTFPLNTIIPEQALKDLESVPNLRIKTFIFYKFTLNITDNSIAVFPTGVCPIRAYSRQISE